MALEAIWNNTDEGVQQRDEGKLSVQRTQALYHTASKPGRAGAALSDNAAHLRSQQTSTHISPLREGKTGDCQYCSISGNHSRINLHF